MSDGVRSRKLNELKSELIAYIASGQFSVGDRLPSEVDLMARFNASRHLLRHALDDLRAEGVITTAPRQGSVVATPTPVHTELRTRDDPTEHIEYLGEPVKNRDEAKPDAARMFGLDPDEPLFYLERKGRHRVNGARVLLARTLPVASLLGMHPHPDAYGDRAPLLQALTDHHGPLTAKERVMFIEQPPAETALLLGMEPGRFAPVAKITRYHRARRGGRLLMIEDTYVRASHLTWEYDI